MGHEIVILEISLVYFEISYTRRKNKLHVHVCISTWDDAILVQSSIITGSQSLWLRQVKSWQLYSWSKKRSNVLEVIIGCLSFFSQADCSMTGVMLFGGSIPLSSKQIIAVSSSPTSAFLWIDCWLIIVKAKVD